MKTAIFFLAALISVGLIGGEALAFTCPVLIKGANESIAKAESAAGKVTEEREKGRALAMVAQAGEMVKEAEADHKQAAEKKDAQLHYRAEAKAKAAKALGDLVK